MTPSLPRSSGLPEPNVHARSMSAGLERRDRLLGLEQRHRELDARVLLGEAGDGDRHDRRGRRLEGGHPEAPAAQAGDRLELGLRLAQLGEDRVGVADDGIAGLGEPDPAGAALHEHGPGLALERGDLLGHGGLGEGERLGRGGERARGRRPRAARACGGRRASVHLIRARASCHLRLGHRARLPPVPACGRLGAWDGIEDRLAELGIELPAPVAAPAGVSLPFELVPVHDDLAYVSGHGPFDGDRQLVTGGSVARCPLSRATTRPARPGSRSSPRSSGNSGRSTA